MQTAQRLAHVIRDAFADYHARFAEITRRAKLRFETRDWAAAREDAVERIELYDQCIAECMLRLEATLQQHAHDPVSYTHLDVYKRQDRCSAVAAPSSFAAASRVRRCMRPFSMNTCT